MRKYNYAVGMLVLAVILGGCSENSMTSIYNNNEKISSQTNSYNLDVEKQKINGQEFSGVVKKIEGMDTIWAYESNKDVDLDIKYLLNVTKGKVKLVLIEADGTVSDIIERSKDSVAKEYATSKIQIKKGLNRIKIVGDKNTSLEFNISIPMGEFKELGL